MPCPMAHRPVRKVDDARLRQLHRYTKNPPRCASHRPVIRHDPWLLLQSEPIGGRCQAATAVVAVAPQVRARHRRFRSGNRSPERGVSPPRRFIIRSKALKSARVLRSLKNRAVSKAETFSATAVTTNWLILVRSSRLNRVTAFFNDAGNLRG